jgi:hypothetical protein
MAQFPNLVSTKTVTIANGAALSGASADLAGGALVAIIPDSAWDTNAVTFQASLDGTNWFNLYNGGTEYSLAGVVASAFCAVDPDLFLGARYVKVRSGTGAAAVNQTGAVVVTLVARPI